MRRTGRDRLADVLIDRCGSDDRVEELRHHFIDQRAAGHGVGGLELASLFALATRTTFVRGLRDVPLWLAGLPLGVMMYFAAVFVYVSHFPGWEQVGRDEYGGWTEQALFWNSIVNWSAVIGVLASIPAGRRLIEHGRHQGWSMVGVPAMVILLGFVGTFLGRFAPANQDTTFRVQSVNELWPPSIAMFLVVAYVPVLFLLADRWLLRRKLATASSDRDALQPAQWSP